MLDVSEDVRAALLEHLTHSIESSGRMAAAFGFASLTAKLEEAAVELAAATAPNVILIGRSVRTDGVAR